MFSNEKRKLEIWEIADVHHVQDTHQREKKRNKNLNSFSQDSKLNQASSYEQAISSTSPNGTHLHACTPNGKHSIKREVLPIL